MSAEPMPHGAPQAVPKYPQLAVVLVLYAAEAKLDRTIEQLTPLAGRFVLVDNAPGGHAASRRWSTDHRVQLLHNGNRGGLAGAYNAAMRWIGEQSPNTEWVMFVDDDSSADVAERFLADAQVRAALASTTTAAVAPAHRERASGLRAKHIVLSRWHWRMLPREFQDMRRVSFVINSMSVWRTEALARIGLHNEWLGVDHVDTEYCLRAQEAGLGIYLHGGHEFAQTIGARKPYRFLGKQLQSGGHAPQRRHSIGRTTTWLALSQAPRHPAFAALCTSRWLYELLGITVAENQRMAKSLSLVRGSGQAVTHLWRIGYRGALSMARYAWSLLKRFGAQQRARSRLADRFLMGEGIEIGALHNPLRTKAKVRYVDRLSRRDLRRHYPELAAFPVVDPDVIDDGEKLAKIDNDSQDFIIANHFIEHCEDPIGTLRTFATRLRKGGCLYLAVPDKRFTFDRSRPSTPLEHLVSDHQDGGLSSRWSHYLEFAQFATGGAPRTIEEATEIATRQMRQAYSIHFHVWTFEEFRDFLAEVTAEIVRELQVEFAEPNRDEGIFILRRS